MKIGEFVASNELRRTSERWGEVTAKLPSIPDGMAMPVECESVKEAQALQSYLFQKAKTNGSNGHKLSVRRKLNTVYISHVTAGEAKSGGENAEKLD